MKTYKQRTEEILMKAEKMRKKARRIRTASVLSVLGIFVLAFTLVLFVPYGDQLPDVSRYSGSPYYDLIQKLNAAIYQPPRYKNNYEKWTSNLSNNLAGGMDGITGWPTPEAGGDNVEMNGAAGGSAPGQSYEEITDNQVEGVIEADIIKRSDQYIYYLRKNILSVYTIAGDESEEVSIYPVNSAAEEDIYWYGDTEMYLSQDCTTLTLVQSCYWKNEGNNGTRVCVINLDVTDPANIKESDRFYMDGSYQSSRMADGKLLLISNYRLNNHLDFSDESTFLPQIGTAGAMESVPADDIVSPDIVTSTHYTVVCKLDSKSLEVEGSAAFLSYSDTLYVSKDHIFATCSYTDRTETGIGTGISKTMTKISCLSYSGDTLEHMGSVDVEGSVKNQYSMDEYEGILRVVTSTSASSYHEYAFEGHASSINGDTQRNVNLYCISMADWSIAASVEGFAPPNETAESVRFDGDTAYVCTAEVITLTDPVYFFDLSDLNHITWKDTGTIDGYSSSLVDFGNGNLLGIGFNGQFGLKIEVYEETANGVASVCVYENDSASFSTDYKSYYIDRENQFIGLGLQDWNNPDHPDRYILLLFDGYNLRELVNTELTGSNSLKRAFYDDGWLYMLGNEFVVESVW